MKKAVILLLMLSLLILTAACGRGGNNALATAETKIEVTGGNGTVSLDENVVRTILGKYSPEELGLKKDVSQYTLKLGNTLVNGADGCLVEAFDGESEGSAAGTFALVGMDLYILDSATGEFKALKNNSAENTAPSADSEKGTEPAATAASTAPVTTTEPFDEEENNNAIRARFEKYDHADLGLKNAITEYVFTPVAATAVGDDGETVYVIKIYEKDGTATGIYAAFNEEHEYSYNGALSVYERL